MYTVIQPCWSVQPKELWLTPRAITYGDYSLLWNFLARVTSLTHLSLPNLRLTDNGLSSESSLIFRFPELQYLHIHIALAPRFADQPMKSMKIITERSSDQLMAEVCQHWQGVVFPVEYLETDQRAFDKFPIEFWMEFLLNVNKVRPPPFNLFQPL